MAYASTSLISQDIGMPSVAMPSVAMPKFRWPRLSPQARALLMMAIMISPCFLCDAIGYCVERFFYTADEIAERQAPDSMLAYINIIHVACPEQDMTVSEHARWAAYAAQHGWPLYPQAGTGCFNPDRDLRGVIGLKAFNVACPATALSPSVQRRWIAYAANHDWTAYPQAGAGCVDP